MDVINYSKIKKVQQDLETHKSAYANQMPLKADKTYVDNQIAINDARINSLDAEVTDAHNSIVKNKNFASLKARLEESEQDLETHKLDYMPHRIQDLKNNKIYKYSLQMSEDGQPQIKFEEVI
jgi:hypothetical protein